MSRDFTKINMPVFITVILRFLKQNLWIHYARRQTCHLNNQSSCFQQVSYKTGIAIDDAILVCSVRNIYTTQSVREDWNRDLLCHYAKPDKHLTVQPL